MSGHSKWAQIKRQKAVTDAARSKIFARYARLIAFEAKRANGNLSEPSLIAAISRAKDANMPKDNIERAIAKGTSKDSGNFDHIVYEAYGPAGVAIIIDAVTANRNRTTQEIKHLLSKNGVELAVPGSALWAFSKTGDRYVPNEPFTEIPESEEERMTTLLETLDEHDDVQEVFTNARGYESTDEEAG